jgi:NADH:ubiquinone oxidoreductase subunit 5 (subunit L)/multisubunit Na+/H+ antiporter MnhA subunit
MLLILLVCTFYSFFIDLKRLEIDSTHLATRAAESRKESTTFSLLRRGSSAARLEVSSKVIFGLNSLRLFSQKPLLAFVLSVAVLNLAGVPPMPGFFAKFFVLMALIGAGYYYYAALSLFLSLLSVFYYIKVLMLFWIDFTRSGNLILGVQQALNSNSAIKKSHTSGLNSFEEGGDNIFASSLKYFIYEEKNKYIFAVLSLVMLFLSGSLFFISTI